jgi:predicted Zn-dependent protease
METKAVFFDGEIAADHGVVARIENGGITIDGESTGPHFWPLSSLVAIEKAQRGHPFRLTNLSRPGARLVINDDTFVTTLIAKAPQLKGGVNWRQGAHAGAWIAGGLAAVAVLTYLVLNFAPQRVAAMLPDSWRQRIGEQIEKSLVEEAKVCSNSAGVAALDAMARRLGRSAPDQPLLTIKVYDIPIMNAFAMPGGRIVMTRELIDKATSADEVAGVLAHEIGHVYHLHSEAQLVRIAGLQVLISAITGTSGGDTLTSIAGLAALLRFSREAEREADGYANQALIGAKIDPAGFRNFFETVKKQQGEPLKGVFSRIGGMMSTHPVTQERIDSIKPLPEGVAAQPSLTPEQWQALRSICDA